MGLWTSQPPAPAVTPGPVAATDVAVTSPFLAAAPWMTTLSPGRSASAAALAVRVTAVDWPRLTFTSEPVEVSTYSVLPLTTEIVPVDADVVPAPAAAAPKPPAAPPNPPAAPAPPAPRNRPAAPVAALAVEP